ncbi:MAG: WD40 repeat domain-containing protein [Planctomycetes bacterium]|nr:WD40 repeat domain-containing protein [Planctomycetota bacterium]
MKNLILPVAFILLLGTSLYAVQSSSWEINNPTGWRKGEMQGAILSADGSLTMGATYTKIALPSQPITDEDSGLWCSATVNDRVYFGSAKGIIYSLDQKENKLNEVFNTGEMLVTTMVADKDSLYAGTIPNGKVFKIDKSGKGTLFCTISAGPAKGDPTKAGQTYVWQLCLDNDNNLYAATGPEGKIYKIDSTGKAEVFYDTKKKNVLSLIFNGKDCFYASTADPGIVYRISLKGRPEIVADLGDLEIKSLVYSPEKNELFIGANKGIRVAPQEFLGLIQQSAKKAAVTPPVPGQAPKDAVPGETKPTLPTETPKHEAPHETPPPADRDHGDHHPPAPPAPDHKSADSPANRDKSIAPERKSQDIIDSEDIIVEETPMPAAGVVEHEPTQAPTPSPTPAPVTMAPAVQSETISVPLPPETPRPPVHCVIYKMSNSFIKEVTALNDCYITELKLNADGVLVAGTDNSGRIYYVFQSGKFFIPYDLDAGQVLTLVMNKDNQLYAAGSGKKAAAYLARTDLAVKAEFTADVWDARFPSRWGNFSFKGQGALMLQVQSGNTAKPDETWSDWSDPVMVSAQGGSASGGKADESVKPNAPTARYFRVKLAWDSRDTVIKEITQNYLVHNQQPRIMGFNIAPVPPLPPTGVIQKMPFRKMNYQVQDPDGDALSYRIYYRAENQKAWILLNQEFPGGLIFQPEFNWLTDSLQDGRYFIKLEATDEKVNPNGTELRDEKISDPVIVDNTRPEIKGLAMDKNLECSGQVVDTLSQIRRIEYSLDGGKWEAAFPADGIMDSNSEDFKFTLAVTAAGFHNIAVRAFDEFGNMGLGQMEFERR